MPYNIYIYISRDLLTKALDWCSTMVEIPEEDRDLIMHTRRSILVNGEETWVKKGVDLFDVTMGAFDGAEVCDIHLAPGRADYEQAFKGANLRRR